MAPTPIPVVPFTSAVACPLSITVLNVVVSCPNLTFGPANFKLILIALDIKLIP